VFPKWAWSGSRAQFLHCGLRKYRQQVVGIQVIFTTRPSPGASLHQTLGFLPPSVHFDPTFAMLKTSGNVLTLLLTGPPSGLSATITTSSFCLPKNSTIPASYLQLPITTNVTDKQLINSYTANPPHRYRPLLALHLQTALPLFSLAKYTNSVCLSPVTPLHHLRTHPLLLPLPLTSQFSPLPRNPKSTRSCPTVQTSNLTQITYRPGFLKNVHPYLFPQSPILSTSPSLPASFIPLSSNSLSHHC